jgi:mannose-6-phosphate isomerase
MDVLRPVVRPYAWGSRDAIAELQGRPVPAPGPEAELWMGAHPSAPSGIASAEKTSPETTRAETTLDAVIAADPERELGAECVARFGPRLPFLLKVLSARAALSIQVHPSRAQAQAGFRAENDRGLAPGDPARNYSDDWPKPELLYALTPFEVLAGLRPPADAARFLRALGVDELAPLAAQLEVTAPELAAREPASPAPVQPASAPSAPPEPASPELPARGGVIACVLGTILDWPAAARPHLVAAVVATCARLASAGGPYSAAAAAAVRIAADHPGDIGVVASLLLRHAVLEPGQAVFMPAGGLHAYLNGTGIELLANSDNVVRAGLTGKHLDVPELLKLLDPAVDVPVLSPQVLADGIASFDTPAPEFRLYVLDLVGNTVPLPGRGPRILLCTEGSAVLRSESGQPTELGRGQSCFVSAADGTVNATGQAHLFLAAVGFLAAGPD